MPANPSVTIEPNGDGGFCVDQNNGSKLGAYIQDLERVINDAGR